ncbi:MAG: HAD family hydrolase [bacterium]|nr:HAD family hydrolase [bacterium]
MIRALFFDLDGTLLTSDKRIDPATGEALRQCRQNGIKVMVATGRSPLLAPALGLTAGEEELLADGGVFYNGGCIIGAGQKRYSTMSARVARECCALFASYPEVNFSVQMVGDVHSFRHRIDGPAFAIWGVDRAAVLPLDAVRLDAVVKIMVFSPQSALAGLYAELGQRLDGEANIYQTCNADFHAVEVVASNVNKKLAVERVAGLYGIGGDELAVFGDGGNDVDMLRGFRHSVAMGNADPEVKAVARFVTRSNDAGGIPHALSNILGLL